MSHWTFTSSENWFSLKLPDNWSEYDDEADNYAFFNTEKWSGNLRISSLRWEGVEEGIDKAADYIQLELSKHPDSILIKLNNWDATFLSKETEAGGIIYLWTTGIKNDLFICSFSFDKPFLGTNWHNNELIVVNEILSSIRLREE